MLFIVAPATGPMSVKVCQSVSKCVKVCQSVSKSVKAQLRSFIGELSRAKPSLHLAQARLAADLGSRLVDEMSISRVPLFPRSRWSEGRAVHANRAMRPNVHSVLVKDTVVAS